MNKKVLIVGTIVILCVLIVVLRMVGLRSQTKLSEPSQNETASDYFEPASQDTENIYTPSAESETTGESVRQNNTLPPETIKDIKDIIVEKQIDITQRGDILFYNSNDFHLIYFAKENEFLISIFSPDFDITRQKAEETFMGILKIDEKTACLLKVHVSTPVKVNNDVGGQDFGLSFCR